MTHNNTSDPTASPALPAPDCTKLTTLPDEIITDKRGFAARWKFSTRHVDNLLAQGMPHCAVGKRRVRIVIAEGDAWMRQQFATRRRRGIVTGEPVVSTVTTDGRTQA